MRKAQYKCYDEITSYGLNKDSRKYIDANTPARRRLKKVLRKQARKRIDKILCW